MSHYKTLAYTRTPIMNYFELNDEQKREADEIYNEDAESQMYVDRPNNSDSAIALENFMVSKHSHWHGVYADTYFSAYLIFIGKRNDEAIVVLRTY